MIPSAVSNVMHSMRFMSFSLVSRALERPAGTYVISKKKASSEESATLESQGLLN